MIELTNAYNTIPDFKEYVDKEARLHRTVPEYMLKCAHIRAYYDYIKKEVANGKR